MTEDLFSQSAAVLDFADRAVSPKRELGAYEALWAREGTWFKSIAEDFRAHPGAIPRPMLELTHSILADHETTERIPYDDLLAISRLNDVSGKSLRPIVVVTMCSTAGSISG